MKKLILISTVCVCLTGCGESKKTSDQVQAEPAALTTEEEASIATEISSEISADKQDIQTATEKSLQEVDSLLENF